MSKKISYSLNIGSGSVSLDDFNNGAEIMEHLAQMVREHSDGKTPLASGVEIRITIEPVRTRGRHAKWKMLNDAAATKAD